MASDRERRKKFWDDEEDETGVVPDRAGNALPDGGASGGAGSLEIDRMIAEIRTLMEQTHQLYLQYFAGIEKRPPIEKVRMLDSKLGELQRVPTKLSTVKFKISQLVAQCNTMKDLWQRKLRELERK